MREKNVEREKIPRERAQLLAIGRQASAAKPIGRQASAAKPIGPSFGAFIGRTCWKEANA
jgi:hypothetical protein